MAELTSPIEWWYEGDPLPQLDGVDMQALRARLLEARAVRVEPSGAVVIHFVGLLVFRKTVIACLPKVRVDAERTDVFRQTLRALKVYARRIPSHHEPSPYLNSRWDQGPVSLMAATDWLLRDYFAHGLYRRRKTDRELNGAGKTHWSATISKMRPIFSGGRPIYVDHITQAAGNDTVNFATMLHLYLLEYLSRRFGALLDYTPVLLDHEPVNRLSSLPSVSECVYRLVMERRATYLERHLELLAMLQVVMSALEVERTQGLALYGTSSFYHVWEAVCGTVLGNAVDSWKAELPSPAWTSSDGAEQTANTFVPDIISALEEGSDQLIIADAKYYRPLMPPVLAGVPGVNDVAKQIWYKQYLAALANERGYAKIHNVFLFPCGEGDVMRRIGRVSFPRGGEIVDAIALEFMSALGTYTAGGSQAEQASAMSRLVALLDEDEDEMRVTLPRA
ncbi:MAG: LlaJI family restriction endonuclease [Castellaniella sp.]